MMTREDRQEALSLAYIKAVAAFAGMTYSVRSNDYGIDITLHEIEERDNRHFEGGVQLDLQVKSTTKIIETRTTIAYDLPIKAYDILRFEAQPTRILVVYVMPPDETDWLRLTRSKLELRKCAYWLSLRGRPAIRVAITKRQTFTPSSLQWIMDRIRAREQLS